MGMIVRDSFALGWMPDADPVRAPKGCLLRADNLILDELNILSLRAGVTKDHVSPLADLDLHSLYTITLGAVNKRRIIGAGNHVYDGTVQLSPTFAGSGDIAFGTHMGQIFMARSTSKWKYDGAVVRLWGIGMTGTAPTIAPSGLSGFTGQVASFDSTESPAFIWVADNGTGASYATGQDGTPNGAAVLIPGAPSAVIRKTWPSNQDFNALSGGGVGSDDTLFSMYVYTDNPSALYRVSAQLILDTSADTSGDHYIFTWGSNLQAKGVPSVEEGNGGQIVEFHNGWNKLTARRGDFIRNNQSFGKDWSTVRTFRLLISTLRTGTDGQVRFDNAAFTGGLDSGIFGDDLEWVYVYVRDNGSYIALSAPSAASAVTSMTAQAATVTIPADASRDTQINQIWIYRRGGGLDDFYRTAVYSGAIGTGSIDITDEMSATDALEIGILLEPDNSGPPDNIIGIEGPYYDRLFALTQTHLYPSRRLNPDSFSSGQVIRVSGADEIALWVKKAFGGLYIGTTKDIYRLDGTGAELPDGEMDFTFMPLNIDNPPRNEAVAQEGNLLVYFAADGWRVFTGAGSRRITGPTSLLYQGYDRHGVSAVNTKGGRFRAAICKGQLVAITPEGASTTTAKNFYRYVFEKDRWYRHVYLPNWRSIHREQDGTLIAGDDAGFLRIIDAGSDDDGADIPVVLWTPREDGDTGHQPKVASSQSLNIDSGGSTFTVQLHGDDGATLIDTATGATSQLEPVVIGISDLPDWRQIQLRLTGTLNRFRLDSWLLNFLALPMGVKAWDSGPMDIGRQDICWARRIRIKVRAAAELTVTPYFDGIAFDPVTIVPVSAELNRVTILDVPVPRGYFGRVPRMLITSDETFYPYWVEFQWRRTTEASEKDDSRIMTGLGGEATA